MGKGEFKDQWREKFEDTESMKLALREATLSNSLQRWASKMKVHELEILDAAENTDFSFLNYGGFAASLSAFKRGVSNATPYSATIIELFDGMLTSVSWRH